VVSIEGKLALTSLDPVRYGGALVVPGGLEVHAFDIGMVYEKMTLYFILMWIVTHPTHKYLFKGWGINFSLTSDEYGIEEYYLSLDGQS
jgi:hypothetical protein